MTVSQTQSSTARWLAAGVFLAAIVAFSPILRNHFIHWDDELIADNPDFLVERPSASVIETLLLRWGPYWVGPTHQLYMPLTYTFWGEISLIARTPGAHGGGTSMSPEIFHAVSLVLHAVNALLVFLLLRRLVAGEWPAFFGALLFAVHPLQTESVAWAAETSILLSGVFSLWAILEFLYFSDFRRTCGNDSAKHSQRRAWIHYGVGTFALALALLSKPSAVMVPGVVLVIEVVFRRRRWQTVVWPLALWAVMCAPIAILTHIWQQSSLTFPLWQRPIIAADALAFYLYKLFLPMGLSINYCRTPAWLFQHHAVVALTWLAPVALGVLALLLWRRARWVMAAVLLFVVPLIPVLGFNVFVFQQFSTTADRYVYLSMLGPALVVAVGMARCAGAWPRVAAGAVITLLAVLSIRDAMCWVDTLALFTPVVEAHPESLSAQGRVAIGYVDQSRQRSAAGDWDGAVESLDAARQHYLIAAGLPGDHGFGYLQAANCLLDMYERVTDNPMREKSLYFPLLRRAIEYGNSALHDPGFEYRPMAYIAIGTAYDRLGEFDLADKAFEDALKASTAPQYANAHMEAAKLKASLDLVRPMGGKPTTLENRQ